VRMLSWRGRLLPGLVEGVLLNTAPRIVQHVSNPFSKNQNPAVGHLAVLPSSSCMRTRNGRHNLRRSKKTWM
jgi:hypothetical protein